MAEITTDDGVQLFYRIEDFRNPWAGEPASTILMHHGFAKNLEWWTPCVPAIARHHRIIRYDARGCGKSSIPPKGAAWTLGRLAKDALNLIDALNIKKVHFVGFESGGVVGLAFAAGHQERTESLSLFNTPSSNWMTTGRMNRFFNLGYANMAEAIDALGFEKWVSGTMAIYLDPSVTDSSLFDWVKRQVTSTPLSVAKEWFRVMEKTDISNLPARVTAPTLIVAGANHIYGCEPVQLDELRRRIPNAREVVYVPGVGSSVQIMAPDACASVLLNFLGSLYSAQPVSR